MDIVGVKVETGVPAIHEIVNNFSEEQQRILHYLTETENSNRELGMLSKGVNCMTIPFLM